MTGIHPARLVVLVPAHNEGEQISATIESLLAQTLPAHRIVVVADNCTDDTVDIASSYAGVAVTQTVGNRHKKSGALLHGWKTYCGDADYVFTMDADTILSPNFFEKAVPLMEGRPDLGGASACPQMKAVPARLSPWGEMLWRLNRLDYGGYMRVLCRWKFVPEVLSGCGTIFRQSALLRVAEDHDGSPWDLASIVEDYKISLDLRRLGYPLAIIPGVGAYTDTPTTVRELWTQRVRWAGGTWQELARAGWQPYTRRVWMTVIGGCAASLIRVLALTAWALVLMLDLPIVWSLWWAIPLAIAMADRVDALRYTLDADWKDALLALAILPMELMSMLRESWTVWSGWSVARRRRLAW